MTALISSSTYSSISSPEIYTDLQGLQSLKRAARDDPSAATKEVAQQFEALFVKMMLKSMRDASFGDEIFGSQQMDAYQDMFDNQMAMHLSKGGGIGLSDVIEKQLNGVNRSPQTQVSENSLAEVNSVAAQSASTTFTSTMSASRSNAIKTTVQEYIKFNNISAAKISASTNDKITQEDQFSSPVEFIEKLWPLAKKFSEESGISPQLLLAQTALETGWGKAVSRHTDGKSSFNLFNIKADHRWDGDKVAKTTLEYNEGVTEKQNASFRSYNSYEESFQDFINFISNEPRYQNAMKVVENNADFITELHHSGYATDPLYAQKVLRVLSSNEMKNALSSIKI